MQRDIHQAASSVGLTRGTPRSALGSSTPLRTMRSRPGRSVTSMRPSGRNAIAQGWTRPLVTTVTRNLVLLGRVEHERTCTQRGDGDADGRRGLRSGLRLLGRQGRERYHAHEHAQRQSRAKCSACRATGAVGNCGKAKRICHVSIPRSGRNEKQTYTRANARAHDGKEAAMREFPIG